MMVMIGGGIIFCRRQGARVARGYLVTPIKKFELIAGFNISGTIRAVIAGTFLMVIGSLVGAELPRPDASAAPVCGDHADPRSR